MQKKIDLAVNLLLEAVREFPNLCFASSLGAEDMVLTDMIDRHGLEIEIFTLDTGRLPQETYSLMQKISERYRVPLKVYFPEHQSVEDYVGRYGINGFYDSMESRKACCHVRKVEPLRRALKGKDAWVTGLRRAQAVTRSNMELSSFDAEFGLHKYNPLLDWSHKDVWSYIRSHDVPYNRLHDEFYPSLGCAPCTRSVTVGEDMRSGRWWWEDESSKECGLHSAKVPSQTKSSYPFMEKS